MTAQGRAREHQRDQAARAGRQPGRPVRRRAAAEPRLVPPRHEALAGLGHALGRPGRAHPLRRPPRRRGDVAHRAVLRGSRPAAHAARGHRLRLRRGADAGRPHRRQGLDQQGRDHARRLRGRPAADDAPGRGRRAPPARRHDDHRGHRPVAGPSAAVAPVAAVAVRAAAVAVAAPVAAVAGPAAVPVAAVAARWRRRSLRQRSRRTRSADRPVAVPSAPVGTARAGSLRASPAAEAPPAEAAPARAPPVEAPPVEAPPARRPPRRPGALRRRVRPDAAPTRFKYRKQQRGTPRRHVEGPPDRAVRRVRPQVARAAAGSRTARSRPPVSR